MTSAVYISFFFSFNKVMLDVQSNSWNKILCEIKSFKDGDYSLGGLIAIHLDTFLEKNGSLKDTKSHLNRLLLSIEDKAKNKNLKSKIKILNHVFFNVEKFKPIPFQKTKPHHFSMCHVLENKEGSEIALVFLYAFLAHHLELPLHFVNLSPHFIFKEIPKNKKSEFYTFSENGRELSEKELLAYIHKSSRLLPHKLQLDECKITDLFEQYLDQRLSIYKTYETPDKQITISECLICLNEMRTDLILDVALMKRNLGLHKEALLDMGRYFHFVEEETAPEEILSIFQELKQLQETQSTQTLH